MISLDAIRRKYKVSPTDKAANGRVVQEAKEEAERERQRKIRRAYKRIKRK